MTLIVTIENGPTIRYRGHNGRICERLRELAALPHPLHDPAPNLRISEGSHHVSKDPQGGCNRHSGPEEHIQIATEQSGAMKSENGANQR